jgi:hypothetical protein
LVLSAGRCGLKRVVPVGSCGLLGEDLGDKEGLGGLQLRVTYDLALEVAVERRAGMLCQPWWRLAPFTQTCV